VTIAAATPANAMNGYISAYNTGTGSMSVVVSTTSGSGTFSSWTIGLSAPIPANAVLQSDIGTAPNEIPLNQFLGNLAFQSSNGLVINPVASAVPSGIGDMVFQLTSDTSLVVKVKGSDNVIRSATLTLA
jgi:hypothetical protein